jgi:hypothetical protein
MSDFNQNKMYDYSELAIELGGLNKQTIGKGRIEMKKGNFTVVCVQASPGVTTLGKIYEIKDSVFTYDDGGTNDSVFDLPRLHFVTNDRFVQIDWFLDEKCKNCCKK